MEAWGETPRRAPGPPDLPPLGKTEFTSPPTAPSRLPPVTPAVVPRKGGHHLRDAIRHSGGVQAVINIDLHDGRTVNNNKKFAMIPQDVRMLIRAARIHPDELSPDYDPTTPRGVQINLGNQQKEPVAPSPVAEALKQALKRVGGVVALITAIVFLGMLAFASIEMEAEDTARAEYSAYMLKLQAKYNISAEDLQEMEAVVGTAIEYDPSSTGGDDRNWGYFNYHTLVFAFSIVTTVGYGSFAPATAGGRAFVILYALVGIPVVASCLGYLAAQLLSVLEELLVEAMDVVDEAFEKFDKDKSGQLSLHELREALRILKIELSEVEFKAVVAEVDDGKGEISLREFKHLASKLKIPIGREKRARQMLKASLGATLAWLVLGGMVFSALEEDWSFGESFYFCVVSLTTVGLGDYVPATLGGNVFNYLYCSIGLGLMAVVLTAIGESIDAWKKSVQQSLAEQADKLTNETSSDDDEISASLKQKPQPQPPPAPLRTPAKQSNRRHRTVTTAVPR